MKEKIAEIRKSLMTLQDQMTTLVPEDPGGITPRAKSLLERASQQLNDAELNLMKLWRIL